MPGSAENRHPDSVENFLIREPVSVEIAIGAQGGLCAHAMIKIRIKARLAAMMGQNKDIGL